MKTSLLVTILLPLLFFGCDPKKATGPTHETKITVQLSGEFKDDEAADVSFDGGGITTISAGQTAYSTVDPGDHTILATAHMLKGTWAHTTNVKEGESKLILIPCDRATLTVTPDLQWLGEVDRFYVKVTTTDGIHEFSVAPGQANGVSFRPRAGVKIQIYDLATLVSESTEDFFYQEKLNLILPYK
jgi:hypothetical protein